MNNARVEIPYRHIALGPWKNCDAFVAWVNAQMLLKLIDDDSYFHLLYYESKNTHTCVIQLTHPNYKVKDVFLKTVMPVAMGRTADEIYKGFSLNEYPRD